LRYFAKKFWALEVCPPSCDLHSRAQVEAVPEEVLKVCQEVLHPLALTPELSWMEALFKEVLKIWQGILHPLTHTPELSWMEALFKEVLKIWQEILHPLTHTPELSWRLYLKECSSFGKGSSIP